jgi:capsular polysaccharide transport system permease protein
MKTDMKTDVKLDQISGLATEPGPTRHAPVFLRPTLTALTTTPQPVRRRHLRHLSFMACVLLPTAASATYEYAFASKQYVSEFRFIVRQQMPETAGPSSALAGLAGGNPMLAMIEDSEVVTQYIASHQILSDLHTSIVPDHLFAGPQIDWLSRLHPNLPPERQLPYWRNMVQASFDLSSGIITVKARAFTPQDAQTLANAVLAGSEALVNQISNEARQNALSYASQTATAAQGTLAADEGGLAAYRNQYSILFPELDAASTTSVGEGLRTKLAEAQATLASLTSLGQTNTSPQVQTLRAQIAAMQNQIIQLNATLATSGGKTQSLASVLSGYDSLMEAEKLDESLYDADLLALQNARNDAAEKSVYLETFVQPSLPESSIYPIRWLVTAETALAGFIAWVLLTLVANIVRDQLD